MLEAKTVFILGAGASEEVGLPLGNVLLKQICALIEFQKNHNGVYFGDDQMRRALKHVLEERGELESYVQHFEAAQQIIQSANTGLSIDNIVHSLEDEKVELVAKLGIVKAIHDAENESRFLLVNAGGGLTFNSELIKRTWYNQLTQIICEGRVKGDIEKVFENLSFVSFNYDRCIEHYLPNSIASYLIEPVEKIQHVFKENLTIHRPYGIAGLLPWQVDGQRGCDFGGGNAWQLAQSAKMIRTFTEAEQPDVRDRIRTELSNADRIVFLGSAFHRQNLELLKLEEPTNVEILATARDISASNVQAVKNELAKIFRISRSEVEERIILAKDYCEPLFRNYRHKITGAANPALK